MNTTIHETNAISPVLAISLILGVTLILSAAIGLIVFEFGQSQTNTDQPNIGVRITETDPGIIKISTQTGNSDAITILVNNEELRTESVEPGSVIELRGVPENAQITVLDSASNTNTIITTQTVRNGNQFATAPNSTTLANIHDNMSTTDANQLIITNIYELQAVTQDPTANYILGNDIDASGTRYWNNGSGFTPIGTQSTQFTGTLDGNNYVIDHIYINRPNIINVGVIGYSNTNSTISNIGVTNAHLTGTKHVGGLIGYHEGTLNASYTTTSTLNSNIITGGAVGYANGGTILNSYSSTNINATSNTIGGLVGYSYHDTVIQNSYATGTITSTGDYIGGLVGVNYGNISKSYSTGSVHGTKEVGGLTGMIVGSDGTIKNSYATGRVTGTEKVGGLVGHTNIANVHDSYATGRVTGSNMVGGLIGDTSGEYRVTSSYWDTESSEQSVGIGSGSGDAATGLQTSEMTGANATTTMSELDFTTTWRPTNTYPQLTWEHR